MTMPMAVIALISWLKNPFNGKKSEVKVGNISRNETVLMLFLTAAVTVLFYFILRHFHTANPIPSTLSVTTSFIAVYLTFRRIPLFAIAYAANDIVLIVLWLLAALEEIRYASVMICFAVFLVNDIYAFINWKHIEKRQLDIGKKEKI
jgi:nicotinamide riboside transporter PnuC